MGNISTFKMKLKKKYSYTKEKRVNFTQQQWNAALEKALLDHPELVNANIEIVENLKATTKINNESK